MDACLSVKHWCSYVINSLRGTQKSQRGVWETLVSPCPSRKDRETTCVQLSTVINCLGGSYQPYPTPNTYTYKYLGICMYLLRVLATVVLSTYFIIWAPETGCSAAQSQQLTRIRQCGSYLNKTIIRLPGKGGEANNKTHTHA